MYDNKVDLRNKCIIITKKLSRENYKKLNQKLKKLGFDDKLFNFQDTQYRCSICIDKTYNLSWYIGIVDSNENRIKIEEFLK